MGVGAFGAEEDGDVVAGDLHLVDGAQLADGLQDGLVVVAVAQGLLVDAQLLSGGGSTLKKLWIWSTLMNL